MLRKNIYQMQQHSRPHSQRLIDGWMKVYCSLWKEDWRKPAVYRRLRKGQCGSLCLSLFSWDGVTGLLSQMFSQRSWGCFLLTRRVSLSPGFPPHVCRVMEYSLDGHNASLSAIRTVRVLRPLRAINRVPSKVLTESLNTSILNECAQTASSPFTNEKTHHKQWIKASSRCANTSPYLTVDNCSASHQRL